MKYPKIVELGDPSSNNQNLINIKLKILCCRYWLLEMWDCHDMVFPYWRIYWNKNEGGELIFGEKTYVMNPDSLYIIPPFTSFSSRFVKNNIYSKGIHVSGRHLTTNYSEENYLENSLVHFFTHFNLGLPFDNVYPGIIKIVLTDYLKDRLEYITERLKIENTNFKITFNLKLQSFIKEVLTNIGPELWKAINIDDRVLKIIRHVESNITQKFSNPNLAEKVNMAPNSFARLFKNEMNITLHSFILNRKIAKSCDYFEHSNKTIEEVAFNLGFSDRYHFSRVFKYVTGLTPASYKSGKYT